MTIQTLKHQYYILQKVRKTEQFEQFLCEDMEAAAGQQYDIFRFGQRELVKKLIIVFMEQSRNRALEDFRECFSRDGELCLVFTHPKEMSLTEKLDGELCILKERILIGKKLLERILLLNMPDMLVYDILQGDSIRVAASLDVSFRYTLDQIENFQSVTIKKVQDRLADIFSILFRRELQLEASTDIAEYIDSVRAGSYGSYLEIYQAYSQLADKLNQEGLVIRPNTFWFRVWEKVKAVCKKVKPVLVTALIVVLAAYLVYSILHPAQTTQEVFNFQRIGTLTTTDKGEALEQESTGAVQGQQ